MSYTFEAEEGTVFVSNSDLSGDVKIIQPGPTLSALEVPGADLIAFVADFVSREKISKLEQAEDREVLGI